MPSSTPSSSADVVGEADRIESRTAGRRAAEPAGEQDALLHDLRPDTGLPGEAGHLDPFFAVRGEGRGHHRGEGVE